jgi:TRAP-type C4-dicarboxylate transport system permease small subunit
MLYKLAEGKTDQWKSFWLRERAVSQAILVNPLRWAIYLASATLLIMLSMNWFVVGQRLTPWAGLYSGAPYEITGFLMGITVIMCISFTWYEGAHIRITLVRDKCGPRMRAFLDALAALTFMCWTIGISGGTWWAAQDALFRGKCSMVLCIPEAPFRLFFCFVAFHFMLVLFRTFIGASLRAARPNREEDQNSLESENWRKGKMIW